MRHQLFFFAAFAGGLSAVGNVPGFDFPSGYTAFQFVFVLLQSAAFGGVFTGFAIARDFAREGGTVPVIRCYAEGRCLDAIRPPLYQLFLAPVVSDEPRAFADAKLRLAPIR